MSNDLKVSIKPRFSCLLPLQEKIEFGHSGLGGVGKVKFFVILVDSSVMRVRSDTFGDPIFQKGLQN